MDRRRLARFVVVGATLTVAAVLSPISRGRLPREQTIHYVLGNGAPQVEEVDACWIERTGDGPIDASTRAECVREVAFRYAHGRAPRVVTHAPRLADGDYVVEINVMAEGQQSQVVRHIALNGGVTAIDLTALGSLSSRDPRNEPWHEARRAEPR